VALTGLLFLIAAAMLAPGLVIGPSLDAAVFNHVGGRLLEGVAPYVGTWDHKPPGIYLASAGVQAALGWLGPWTADWLLTLAASTGIGAAVASVLQRLGIVGWPRWLAAISATILGSHYLLALGGGLTEPLAAVLVAWALLLVVRPATTSVRLAGIGVLVSVAIVVSVQVVVGGAAVLALGLLLTPTGTRRRAAVFLALGFAAPLVATLVWLLAIGALPAAVDALVTYSAAYRGSVNQPHGADLAASVAAWTTLVSLFVWAPALLGLASLTALSRLGRDVAVTSVVWVAGSLLLFVGQGRFYAHYAIPLAVPLGLLAGIGLDRARKRLRGATRFAPRSAIIVPLLAALVVSVVAGTVSAALQLALVADQNLRAEAVALRVGSLPSGSMLVWGNQPALYALAHRDPASKYSYLYPLTTPGYSTPALISAVARALEDHPPEVVVDAGSNAPGQPGFPPLLIVRPIATDGRDLDLLSPLRAFVAAHYDLAATVAGWPIYVLRPEPAT
jgi:hypothetical protein